MFFSPSVKYIFYPKENSINSHGPEIDYEMYFNAANNITDYDIDIDYNIRFKSDANLTLKNNRKYTLLLYDFDPSRSGGEPLPAYSDYEYSNYTFYFRSNGRKKIYTSFNGKIGGFFNGKIKTLITRSSKNRQMMEVSNTKGKRAVTNYKTIEIFENKNTPLLSFLECKLETGRTHQIRVHMNFLGNSIVGDDKYKKKFKMIKNIDPMLEKKLVKLNRQFLHAKTLGFFHPRNNKEMIFNSILPQDLEIILKMLRKASK